MKNKVKAIQKQYTSDFSDAAFDYLKVGLELFHKRRYVDHLNSQVILGNISIAIELFLKAFLVSKNLTLVFTNLPLDLKTILTCPDQIQANSDWGRYDLEFRFASYKTLKIDECITSFFVFSPDLKEKLNSHLRFVVKHRNTSVHSVLPQVRKYEIERAVFVALTLFESLKNIDLFKLNYLPSEDKNRQFMKNFQEKRIDRVKRLIEKAKEKAHKTEERMLSIGADGWEEYAIDCPICGSEALLEGYTEFVAEQDEIDSWSTGLDFFADTFYCHLCGLKLEEMEELRLAGIETVYDRTSELDKWHEDSLEY